MWLIFFSTLIDQEVMSGYFMAVPNSKKVIYEAVIKRKKS